MNFMQSECARNVVLLSVFMLLFTGRDACAAEGAGGFLQQLEKPDTTYKFNETPAPVIEEQKQPDTEKRRSEKKIYVKRFRVEGNTLISEKELLAGVSLAGGKLLTLEEITSVAELITARYRARGYIIAYAYVPSQSIFDGAVMTRSGKGFIAVNAFGIVTLKVVEGKVGQISVTGNEYYRSSFIEKYLAKVRNDPSLKLEILEKELLLLNDYPSLSVKTTLKAGKERGTTDIIATVSDKYPLFGSVSYDNYGVSSTSKNRLSAALNVGNVIASGDLVRLTGIIGLDTFDPARLSYGRVEYSVPVGGGGTQVGAYYSNTVYAAGGNDSLAIINLNGKASVIGLYVTHPLIKKLASSLTLRCGGESVSVQDSLATGPTDQDEIRKLTAGLSYELTDRFLGRNSIGVTYARGLGDFMGGTGSGATGTSHLGANDAFNKLTLEAMRIQKLPGYSYLVARGNVQYSPDRLFSAERIQVGGVGSVRGADPAALSGDSGYLTSLELVSSPFYPDTEVFNQKLGDTVQFALFTDYGGIINTAPRPSETSSADLSCIGAGLRLYGGNMFSFKMDWAIPGTRGSYGGFSVNASRLNVQAMVSF